jgi:hypothetical protein
MSRSWPNLIATLSVGCFAALLAMWLGVDLNGRFMQMDENLTSLIGLGIAVTGCWASCVMFRYQPKHRFLAVLVGVFCAYCLFDIGWHSFS